MYFWLLSLILSVTFVPAAETTGLGFTVTVQLWVAPFSSCSVTSPPFFHMSGVYSITLLTTTGSLSLSPSLSTLTELPAVVTTLPFIISSTAGSMVAA